jgi:hypothetical protein
MSLEAVLIAVVNALRPTIRNVEAAPGPLDKGTLSGLISSAPGVRVAPIGVVSAESVGNGQVDYTIQFAAYAVAKPARTTDLGAITMVGQLLVLIPGQTWGVDMAQPVEGGTIRADTLVDADMLAKGVSLWAVTWRQTVRLGTDVFAGDEGIQFPPVADARHDDGRFTETAVDLRDAS